MPDLDSLYDKAEALLDRGDMPGALAIYKDICSRDSTDPEALFMCGMVHAELGQTESAIHSLKSVMDIDSGHSEAELNLARLFAHSGRDPEALGACRRVIEREPGNAHAWIMLSGLLGKAGVYHDAEAAARKAEQLQPDSAEAVTNLGNALREQGKLPAAIEAFERALKLDPDVPAVLVNIAICHEGVGDLSAAESCLRKVVDLDSGGAAGDAYALLGNLLVQQGRPDEAMDAFQKALAIQPGAAWLKYRIGLLLGDQNRLDEALAYYQQAIGLVPEIAEAHDAAGTIYRLKGETEKALQAYRQAIGHKPDFADAHVNLADLLQEDGRYLESIASYENALRYTNRDAVKIKHATVLPVILSSADEIMVVRSRFEKSVKALINEELVVDNPFSEVSRTAFYLVYHGLDDRALHEAVARLYEKSTPSLLYTAPHCGHAGSVASEGRIKVGMISSLFYHHTIGTVMKGFVERFSRERFHVTVFTFPYQQDDVTEYIHAHADRVVNLPREWGDAHEVIADEQLDIIFYTDIGMDPYTYFLSFARLAPVQFTTWGHPVTTGVGNMDYYLTCRHFEPENGHQHYTEKLVELSGLPTYYERPVQPDSSRTRLDYGLEDTQHVYLCPQTLYKFHPDFDEILGRILRQDKQGVVVMIDCPHVHWQELLLDRMSRQIPDVVDRIVVLHYPGSDEYLHLLTLADVMLDTLHYGGGSTSLQALAFGVPIVTLPGALQRSRHTYGYYKIMGFTDCVAPDANDYVDIALRLGNDAEYRAAISRRILQLNPVLFENQRFVDEIEEFMVTAVSACRASSV